MGGAIDPFLGDLKLAQIAGQQVLAASRNRATDGVVLPRRIEPNSRADPQPRLPQR